MDYASFQAKLNAEIFAKDICYQLLLDILEHPERYTGLLG